MCNTINPSKEYLISSLFCFVFFKEKLRNLFIGVLGFGIIGFWGFNSFVLIVFLFGRFLIRIDREISDCTCLFGKILIFLGSELVELKWWCAFLVTYFADFLIILN